MRLEELETQLAGQVATLSAVLSADVSRFNEMLQDAGVPGIVLPDTRAANRYP